MLQGRVLCLCLIRRGCPTRRLTQVVEEAEVPLRQCGHRHVDLVCRSDHWRMASVRNQPFTCCWQKSFSAKLASKEKFLSSSLSAWISWLFAGIWQGPLLLFQIQLDFPLLWVVVNHAKSDLKDISRNRPFPAATRVCSADARCRRRENEKMQ